MDRQIPLQLQHVGIQITGTGDGVSGAAGQTFWAWKAEEGEAGVAWDWVELGHGLVAMADPLAVVTNLQLVGQAGETLSRGEVTRHINGIVRQLPWQTEVGRLLRQLAAEAPVSARGAPTSGGAQRLAH